MRVGLNRQFSFIKLHLGATGPEPDNAEALHAELAELKEKCDLLMAENKELRNRVRKNDGKNKQPLHVYALTPASCVASQLMQYEPETPSNGAAE